MIFAAQGDQLSLWLDGHEVASARDGTLRAGNVQLGLLDGARIRKVEFGELPDAEPWQDVLPDRRSSFSLTGGADTGRIAPAQ